MDDANIALIKGRNRILFEQVTCCFYTREAIVRYPLAPCWLRDVNSGVCA
jgi:hypothetical protein